MVLVVHEDKEDKMAYFLKVNKTKNRTYLAIYESFYDPSKKGTAHKCYMSLKSVETQQKNGIENPIEHFQKVVDELNAARKEEGVKQIGETPAVTSLGYFPIHNIMEKLGVKKYINYFNIGREYEFDFYDLLSSLVYARFIRPCSKHKTFYEVFPTLYEKPKFSYDQLLSGLGFLGNVYEKIVEIFTVAVKEKININTETTYFDCTNFYFEIDREDDFRRKGPSKERHQGPIVGLGLLLDKNQIPIGMKMFPGNESEKPVLRSVVTDLKQKGNISGRTIHVADKGLNCAQNIAFTKKNKDGYIFSKSVKTLPKIEKDWVLISDGYETVRDESGKTLYMYKSCVDKYPYTFLHEGKKVTVEMTEKRIVTYNPVLAKKQKEEIHSMVLKASGMTSSLAKKKDFGPSAVYFNFFDKDGKKATPKLNQKKVDADLALAGLNMIVTSEIDMSSQDIYKAYHNLWKIEETFRIMKSDLEGRPAFVSDVDKIKGHFLICYINVLLERILELEVLEGRFSYTEIFNFIRSFKATKDGSKYINTGTQSRLMEYMKNEFGLPLSNFYLSGTNIKSMFNNKIKFEKDGEKKK